MTTPSAFQRLPSGLPELDDLLGGGYPRGSSLLVRGGPGSGKTLLGLHYVAAAQAARETALFISFSDAEPALRAYAHQVNIDIGSVPCLDLTPSADHLASEERYEIFTSSTVEQGPVSQRLIEAIQTQRPARVFIDGFSLFRYLHPDLYQYRRQLIALMRFLREQGSTALFASELSSQFSDDELTFAADGVLTLHRRGALRQLEVEKLRAGGYADGLHRYELGDGGWHLQPSLDWVGEERLYAPHPQPTGFSSLDDLLGGGLLTGSTTLLCGYKCVGKSLWALALADGLAGATGRVGLLLLDEPEAPLLRRVHAFGLSLPLLADTKRLHVEAARPGDSPETLLHLLRLLAEPRRCDVLVVDSLNDFLLREGGEPGAVLWRQLCRYAARRGVVLLATWRQEPGDGPPPAGLADTEIELLPASPETHPGLRVRHHRYGEPRFETLSWQMDGRRICLDGST